MVMEFVRGETVHELSERLGPLAPPQAAHLVHAGARRARARAPRRRRPSRPQAGEPDDHRDRRDQGHGLRHRARARHRALHAGRLHDGHAGVHGAGAGARRRDRRPRRSLRRRRRALPPALRPAAVQRRHRDRDGAEAGQRAADADRAVSAGPAAVVRARSSAARSRSRPPIASRRADEFRAALLSAVQPQALGELPTVATPTPPGLHVASDATRLQTVSGRSTQFGVPGGAAAVATPLAQTSPAGGGGTPVPPHPTSSTRPIDPVGHTTTVVLNRKHLIGMGLIATLIVIALVGAGWFAMRRSAFPPQMQIGAAPTEEAKPVEPAPAPPADQAPSAAAQPEDPGQTPPVPPPAPSAPVPPKPIDSAAGVTAGSPKPGGRAGTLPDGTLPAGARGARGTAPVPRHRSSRRRPLPRLRRRRPPHLRPLRRQPRHRSHSRTSGCS